MRNEYLYAHTIAVKRPHHSKNNNPLFIFTFLKPFLPRICYQFLLLGMPYRLGVLQLMVCRQVIWKENKKERAV